MKNETYHELFKISHKKKDNLVTPIILEYFTLESQGLKEDEIVKVLMDEYKK